MTTATAQPTPKKSPARWQADVALAIVALIWGATFVVVKRALLEISTMYFLAVRFGLASLCMLVMFAASFLRMQARWICRALGGGAVAGIFLWLGYVLQTFGLKYTSAGNSGFLTGMYIVLVPLIRAAICRRWPERAELAGISVATAGMALLTLTSIDRQFRIIRWYLLNF